MMKELFEQSGNEMELAALKLVTLVIGIVMILIYVIMSLSNGSLAVWNWGTGTSAFWAVIELLLVIVWGFICVSSIKDIDL